ncbi:MAG TPA: endonuclease/exonuclease/phosphatase family protein [Bacteriovoracaceae bacterium]|nr:endonuclease/exonuclease/phosphatase family protein [Bacteriovoracaceae bacterium]
MLTKILSFSVLALLLSPHASFARSIKIMSYNVENLFDTQHDSGKEDYTFLPMNHPEKIKGCETIKVDHYKKTCLETDWTDDKLELKLTQIEKVVKSTGSVPDILALMEVENARVIQRVQRRLGYRKVVMTTSDDERGIDVAILFNPSADLAFLGSKEIKLQTSRFGITSATRNILEMNFKIKDKLFQLYLNHWPSQQSGPGSRSSAAEQLFSVVKDKINDPNTRMMMIGDFNVTDAERPNPIYDFLTNKTGLVDVFTLLTRQDLAAKNLPPGTYFYSWDFSWNRLDKVIVNANFLTGTPSVNPKSYNVYAPAFMNRLFEQKNPERPGFGQKALVPWGYWHNAYTIDRAGFSDHYPLQVEISL